MLWRDGLFEIYRPGSTGDERRAGSGPPELEIDVQPAATAAAASLRAVNWPAAVSPVEAAG